LLRIWCPPWRKSSTEPNASDHVWRQIATELYLRFHEEVGHTVCAEIHMLKFARTYHLYDPEDQKAFHERGGHSDTGCPFVCAAAARIAADIIMRLRGSA
jgi:hypothetical protein